MTMKDLRSVEWIKFLHMNRAFFIRNETELTECVWKKYVHNYAL
jgi:hypothetical protein